MRPGLKETLVSSDSLSVVATLSLLRDNARRSATKPPSDDTAQEFGLATAAQSNAGVPSMRDPVPMECDALMRDPVPMDLPNSSDAMWRSGPNWQLPCGALPAAGLELGGGTLCVPFSRTTCFGFSASTGIPDRLSQFSDVACMDLSEVSGCRLWRFTSPLPEALQTCSMARIVSATVLPRKALTQLGRGLPLGEGFPPPGASDNEVMLPSAGRPRTNPPRPGSPLGDCDTQGEN